MTIASEIQRIEGNISDAYNSCAIKGATMPVVQNSAYLADTINSITGGGGGADGYDLGVGKYYIDNGVAKSPQAGDVSNAFQMITSIVDNGMNGACQGMNITGHVNFANLTTIGNYGLYNAFRNCKYITDASFDSLTNISNQGVGYLSYAFLDSGIKNFSMNALTRISTNNAFRNFMNGYQNIISVSLANITYIGNTESFVYAFSNCPNLTNINFDNLITISGDNTCYRCFYNSGLLHANFPNLNAIYLNNFENAFEKCNNLTSVNFDNLSYLGGWAMRNTFAYCTNLINIYFRSLNNLTEWMDYNSTQFSYCFRGCTNMKDIYFNALTITSFGDYNGQFRQMLNGVDGCNVHFPSAIQSTIGSWSDVIAGFGGTNTTVLFDL